MAKRSHLTEVGCIACEELSEFGAGKEGWLVENPSLLAALDTHSIALSDRSVVLILDWNEDDPFNRPVKIRPSLPPAEGEITAIEWLVFDDIRVISLGTSNGYLLIYSVGGDLIHKQMIYPGRVLRLRARGTRNGFSQNTSSEEVSIVMPGVIARFDGSDIQNLLQRWLQEARSQFWDQKLQKQDPEDPGSSYGRLRHQLWNVSKYGTCLDAAITGIMPPPLMEVQLLLFLGSQVNVTILQSLLERMLYFQLTGFRKTEADL
ncbi:uncharacterized protein LOC122094077 isoform X2 [Macadamia integrifolia]|uniref:uncharacterized protein LOC122094077 isoform X2 n=1 Tax=Macadamia integrifolia TaxID=60698 RepID=UPI001C52E440|nr:uncharacterized protein LOC122094077 isoform X2 [Macadamia integrifolia]